MGDSIAYVRTIYLLRTIIANGGSLPSSTVDVKLPSMTACISAIAEDGKKVIVAADDMLTHNVVAGGPAVQRLDQGHDKTLKVNDRVYALAAGANHVIHPVFADIALKVSATTTPQEAAEIARVSLRTFYLQKVAEEILMTYNLTWDTFGQANPSIVPIAQIQQAINGFNLDIAIIVAGVDQTESAYVSVVSGQGALLDRTSDGVVAVGSGGHLASVSMILSDYQKSKTVKEITKMVKKAMKDAKRTPGVGNLAKLEVLPLT
jgi:hypothetical protein